MKKFALMGAAGFVAPRHMRAIKENDCSLVAAVDPFDSVGIIDSYFPRASFFTEVERFDRHIDKLKRSGDPIDFFSICTPNYLHDSHIRLSLRNGCDAICEKPLVIRPKNLKNLKAIEDECGKRIYSILQLRHHPVIIQIKNDYRDIKDKAHVKLQYITSRGEWYHRSWKGDVSKSGGLPLNIGIHFFDMLTWVFGDPVGSDVFKNTKKTISGLLRLERADVEWVLSIDEEAIPDGVLTPFYRSILINNKELEFSKGFKDLHTVAYREILEGRGYGIDDVAPSLSVVYDIMGGE